MEGALIISVVLFGSSFLFIVIALLTKNYRLRKKAQQKDNALPSLSCRVQGKEYTMPVPTADKFASWVQLKEANEINANSCERIPSVSECLVPISFFALGCGLAGWPKYDYYWKAYKRASWNGYNNIVVSISDYEEAKTYIVEAGKRERMLNATTELNNKGIELEKCGEISAAIAIYEECIKLRYPATHAYWRLAVLYRKAKDRANEVRVIRVALEVFPEDKKFAARLNKVLSL